MGRNANMTALISSWKKHIKKCFFRAFLSFHFAHLVFFRACTKFSSVAQHEIKVLHYRYVRYNPTTIRRMYSCVSISLMTSSGLTSRCSNVGVFWCWKSHLWSQCCLRSPRNLLFSCKATFWEKYQAECTGKFADRKNWLMLGRAPLCTLSCSAWST